MTAGLRRMRLSKDYDELEAGDVYECDPVRAQWIEENGYGSEDTGEPKVMPRRKRDESPSEDEPEPERAKVPPRRRRGR